MYRKFLIILICLLSFECSKKEIEVVQPSEKDKALKIYNEGVKALNERDFFYASTKFSEAELILPTIEASAKSSLLASYCLYTINFYDEALENLERFVTKYRADKNLSYAHYLIALSYYEQILDEKKDLQPVLLAKEKFEDLIIKFPDTDYATDARFKLDLIVDQLAAKEMSIARYYMETEKWIPALNRLKTVVEEYDKTVFIEEALHRLVEVNYKLGLIEESKKAASILGYNYRSGEWYERSYKVFNKKYKTKKIKKKKELGLIRRKIKSLFE